VETRTLFEDGEAGKYLTICIGNIRGSLKDGNHNDAHYH
jgi:hypothetical protein